MRIVQIGDTHLGYTDSRARNPMTGEYVRYQDTIRAWHEACRGITDQVKSGGADLVIHTGDLFDNARPGYRVVEEAIGGLLQIANTGVPMVIIGGNHDTPRVTTSGSVFGVIAKAMPDNVSVVAGYQPVAITGYQDFDILCLPYGALAHRSGEAIPDMIQRVISGPDDKPRIMVAHGTLEGAIPQIEQFTGHDIPRQWIDGFDHVALGHLHCIDRVDSTRALYNGSTNRFGFADVDAEPGWWDVQISAGSWWADHHPVWTRDMIDMGVRSIHSYDGYEAMADQVLRDIEDVMFDRDDFKQYPMIRVPIRASSELYRYASRMIMSGMGHDRWRVRVVRDDPKPMARDQVDHRDRASKPSDDVPSLKELFAIFRSDVMLPKYGAEKEARLGSVMQDALDRAIIDRHERDQVDQATDDGGSDTNE